jgi:hypothetical protein
MSLLPCDFPFDLWSAHLCPNVLLLLNEFLIQLNSLSQTASFVAFVKCLGELSN